VDDRGRAAALAAAGLGPGKAARLFAALDPSRSGAQTGPREAAMPLLVIALVVVAVGRSTLLRTLLPLGLAAVALMLLVLAARRGRAGVIRRGVSLDGPRLFFHTATGAPRVMLSAHEPFGMTLVTGPRRDRVVAVLSSAEGLFHVGAYFPPGARALGAMLERTFTVAADDTVLSALGPDGEPLWLSPSDFCALVFALEELDPACVERLVLSDARGAPLTLDGRELAIAERRFDLTAPLEWRAFVFQEAFGAAIAVYQGTWIRQGPSEVTLVALLPSIVPFEPGEESEIDRSLLRDLRLMQASPEEPPPREQRVAFERLFVLPVRAALDRAPRASQQPSRARA
jgi:hypothetical protein